MKLKHKAISHAEIVIHSIIKKAPAVKETPQGREL